MSIQFYYGSGSPWAWRVWLALEHKQLAYEMNTISFSAGDTRKPEFLAMNPRHKVPVIKDGDFVLYESAAICEYLEEAYPSNDAARSLWPKNLQQRALARRLAREAEVYFGAPVGRLGRQLFMTAQAQQNAEEIEQAREEVLAELAMFENAILGDYLAGPLSLADYTLYPFLALALRAEAKKRPSLGVAAALGPKLKAWRARVEALPYFDKCVPPHWKG